MKNFISPKNASVNDILAFDYNGKFRLGKVVTVRKDSLTVKMETDDSNDNPYDCSMKPFKTFRFADMVDVHYMG